MQEQQRDEQPFDGMPATPQQEQHVKTLAIRVEEGIHTQLRFIAQLSGTSITEEIRRAIEHRITTAQDDPELIARAQQVRSEIEREAAARSAAIAGFMGSHAVGATTSGAARGRRTSKPNSE
jgi:hypothetical protein